MNIDEDEYFEEEDDYISPDDSYIEEEDDYISPDDSYIEEEDDYISPEAETITTRGMVAYTNRRWMSSLISL